MTPETASLAGRFVAGQFDFVAYRDAFHGCELPCDQDRRQLRLLSGERRRSKDPDERERRDAARYATSSPMSVNARHARIIATLRPTPLCALAGFVISTA